MSPRRIGITLGDPGGIGPEIVVKALAEPAPFPAMHFTLFGNARLIEREERRCGLKLDRSRVTVRDIDSAVDSSSQGTAGPVNGLASFRFFEEAVRAAREGDVDALATAPISKHAWALAGLSWHGHTEYLGSLYPDSLMTFWSKKMTVALFTHHISLAEAVRKVTRDNLVRFFLALSGSVERVRPGTYQFVVAGLNPHAGENGLLGREEEDEVIPAVAEARARGLNIRGPYPPDVVFREALGHPEKIVAALYHDQGLIPFKLSSFGTGVNVTLGMPFVRTSPDHGTAFDIAGRNAADPTSMAEAIRLAVELSPGPL
jgi:4-hydroxythreonine-4-phosphate dehydrogenase